MKAWPTLAPAMVAAVLLVGAKAAAQTPVAPASTEGGAPTTGVATTGDGDGNGAGDRDREPADADMRWRPRPSFRIGDLFRLDVRYRTQANVRRSEASLDDDQDDGAADFASHRIGLEGQVFGVLEYEVERNLAGDEPWRDVYVNYRQFRAINLQAGHFRVPFSLDENTGATNRDFVYRSLAARQLAPGRDTGLMLHGRVIDRRVRYEVGMFREDGRNARPGRDELVAGGRTWAARVAVQPWRGAEGWLEDVHVGVAVTGSDVPLGVPALRGETVLGSVFFASDTPVFGSRRRTGVEFRWRPGPFSLASEYMRVTTERRGQSLDNADLSPLLASGWYASASWVITGEDKAGGLDRPARPVHRGGPGAIELAARAEGLTFRSVATGTPTSSPRADVIAPNTDRAVTLGLNWYLNRYVKLQANLVREWIADPSRGPLPAQRTFWSRVLQLQFTL